MNVQIQDRMKLNCIIKIIRRAIMKINDLTPKQFARREIIKYLRDLFDNPAKYITNFESYTHKQQEEILRFISLDEDRIDKLLNKPMENEK
jgi:hypothetical protein